MDDWPQGDTLVPFIFSTAGFGLWLPKADLKHLRDRSHFKLLTISISQKNSTLLFPTTPTFHVFDATLYFLYCVPTDELL